MRAEERRWMRRALVAVAIAGVTLAASACASRGDPLAAMGAEELWNTGLEAYEAGDWEEAIRAFEQLVNRNPGYARNPQARMHTAQAYMARREFLTAASEYERILQLHPGNVVAPDASLGVCRAYARLAPHPQRDQRYTQRARDACGRTILEHPLLDIAEEAAEIREEMIDLLAEGEYEEGRFYQRRGAHNSAILIFEEVVNRYPETRWAPAALLAMYRSYRSLGWEEEAVETAERILGNHPDSEPANQLRRENAVNELLSGAEAEDGP